MNESEVERDAVGARHAVPESPSPIAMGEGLG